MTDINLQSLNELYAARLENQGEWRSGMLQGIDTLIASFTEHLQPEHETWTDPFENTEHHYIELLDPFGDKPALKAECITDHLDEEGRANFCIGIFVERDNKSYPKKSYYSRIAMRYRKQQIEYSLWDAELEAPQKGSQWESSADNLVKLCLSLLAKGLAFDLKEGYVSQSQIGFVTTD